MLHPHLHLHLRTLNTALDFTGIAVGGMGGALHARQHARYQYDIIGVFGLALVSALGGGVLRDLLIQAGPPLALTDPYYLWIALGAAAVTLPLRGRLHARTERFLLLVDALAIALFAVAGATRALSFGLAALPALLLGLLTAVGGGSLRDVLSGTTPRVFERGNFYAVAAGASALTYLVLDHLDVPDTWSVPIAVFTGFALRILSVLRDWRTEPLRF